MSLLWMSRVFAAPAPVGTDRVMLLALADNANDEGFCWPGVETLRRKCGLATERGTRKVLDRLVEWSASATAGCVVLSLRHRDGRSNVYTLALCSSTPEPEDRGVLPDRGERTDQGEAVLQDRGGAVPRDRAGAVRADRGGLSSGTAEPSENPNQNPHHNHQARGDGALTLVPPPAGVVVVGDDRKGGMLSEVHRPDPGASARSVEALVERGVTEPVAARLASDFAERIDAALAAFDRSGQYGAGWLVRAVEAGWAEEKPEVRASREQGAARTPQGAYGPVAEPRRMQAQAVLWLEQQGHPAAALTEFFEPAGTWEMDPDTPPVPMYRLRVAAAQAGAVR